MFRAGNRAAPDIEFVNKYPPSWMKKVVFSQVSSILLMVPLKFIAMNTFHIFLDPTVYLFCRKICEYKSYTGMKNRSERKFPCSVQITVPFCNLVMKIGVLSRKPTCFSHRTHKNSYKMFLWILWLKQVGFLDNTPIFITKLQKMHFSLHPAREFFLASTFHSRVTFIFANLAAQQIYRWIKKTVERVHYYKFQWQHQQDRRKLGKPYLFHLRWRIFVYKLNVGSSAITHPNSLSVIIFVLPGWFDLLMLLAITEKIAYFNSCSKGFIVYT